MKQQWKKIYPFQAAGEGRDGTLIYCSLGSELALFLYNILSTSIRNVYPDNRFSPGNPNYISINYCFRGRCELCLNNGAYTYLSQGELAIDAGFVAKDTTGFYYPAADYLGIELAVNAGDGWNEKYLLNGMPFQVPAYIFEKVRENGQPFITKAGDALRLNADHLREGILGDVDCTLLQLDVLRFLVTLQSVFSAEPAQRTFLTYSQVQIAKEVHDLLIADLSKRYSALELSSRFSISETSMKNYFRSVYGTGYARFQSEQRMNKAAGLLAAGVQNVSEIAEAVGYSNQSRFAKAFRQHFGVSPLEYRRRCNLNGGNDT